MKKAWLMLGLRQVAQAWKLLEYCRADGPQPDVQSFNALMGVVPEKKVRLLAELCWVKSGFFYGKLWETSNLYQFVCTCITGYNYNYDDPK